jgi:hypothetical protein
MARIQNSNTETTGAEDPRSSEEAPTMVQALPQTNPGYIRGALQAFTKKVLLFVRQSSMQQVHKHRSSVDVQLRQIEHFNVPEDRIVRVMALGESGAGEQEREQFERMLTLLESKEIGVVAVARHDRIGRNDRDHARFIEVMAEHGVRLMVDGHVFDPSSPEDKMILGIYGQFAEYENKLRTRWMRLTALASAKRLSFRVPLPAPFLWASPDDPTYVERMHAEGLSDWLSDLPQEPVTGRAYSKLEGKRFFPLPAPDREAVTAAELMLRWTLETGSIVGAAEKTMTDPAWPTGREGRFPSLTAQRWIANETVVHWPSIEQGVLKTWMHSPALQGTYSYRASSLAKKAPPDERHDMYIVVPNAFRGLLSEEDARRLQQLTRAATSVRKSINRREHVIPLMYCGHVYADESVCGARLFPSHSHVTSRGYLSDVCPIAGHISTVHGFVDDIVLDTVAEVLSRDALALQMDRERLEADSRNDERRDVEAQAARTRERRDGAAKLALEAHLSGQHDRCEVYNNMMANFSAELKKLEQSLRKLSADGDTVRALTRADIDDILSLGTNLPALIARVRRHPALGRRLLRELGVTVYQHSPGKYAHHLEVRFPSGARAERWAFALPVPSTQATRVFCFVQLQHAVTPSDIVSSLRELLPQARLKGWGERRVLGASLMHEHNEPESSRPGTHRSLRQLAKEVGVSQSCVLKQALAGTLGPAQRGNGPGADSLLLAPTENELHTAFPEYARRWAAEKRAWPLDDTIRLADAARLTWQPAAALVERANTRDGRCGTVTDKSRRSYVRLSRVRVDEIDAAVERAFAEAPTFSTLDPEHWCIVDSNTTNLAYWPLIADIAPRVSLPNSSTGTREFAWIGPSVLTEAVGRDMKRAVDESPHHWLAVADFYPAELVLATLNRRLGYPTAGPWFCNLKAAECAIPQIYALNYVKPGLRTVRYVHAPAHIMTATDPDVVRAWLVPGWKPKPNFERRARKLMRERAVRLRDEAKSRDASAVSTGRRGASAR